MQELVHPQWCGSSNSEGSGVSRFMVKCWIPTSAGSPNCERLRRNYSAPPRFVWGPLIVQSYAFKQNIEKKNNENRVNESKNPSDLSPSRS